MVFEFNRQGDVMRKIIMYAHGGSGNHGCEAIVRSTADILNGNDLTLISSKPEEDCFYNVDRVCSIIKDRSTALNKKSIDFIKAYLSLKLKKSYVAMDSLWYKEAFSNINKGDVALSIGGDNYCYSNVKKYIMMHDMIKKRGAQTVLWGCSVEPEVTKRDDVAADLARFDLITARETISYDALIKVNPNTKLVSDPAFCLKPRSISLPEGFVAGKTVGINLSPMTIELESSSGIAYDNYKKLISYIIDKTDEQIALIPHVIWDDGDDRKPLIKLYNEFKDTGRVVLVPDNGCCEQKFLISQCSFFVGARTHATIAAYSTGVPTLVLGYSVKAKGIARDLFGTEENYVLPVQNLKSDTDVLDVFIKLYVQRESIHKHLNEIMPEYIEKAKVDINLL